MCTSMYAMALRSLCSGRLPWGSTSCRGRLAGNTAIVPNRSSLSITGSSHSGRSHTGSFAPPASVAASTSSASTRGLVSIPICAKVRPAPVPARTTRPCRSNKITRLDALCESRPSPYSSRRSRRCSSREFSAASKCPLVATAKANRWRLNAPLSPATLTAPRTVSSVGSRMTAAAHVHDLTLSQ